MRWIQKIGLGTVFVFSALAVCCFLAESFFRTCEAGKRPRPDAGQVAFLDGLVAAAIERTKSDVVYDPSYRKLSYPGGDVPEGTGVCTDVLIRSFRKVGVDLQKDVHEHMKRNFRIYPKQWGLKTTDRNIDHRRVPNLMVFFKHKGVALPITTAAEDYLPGDIVCWRLGGNLTHIGIVTDRKTLFGNRPKIVHNIGQGPKLEDMLFEYDIIGHYLYFGS